MNMRNLLAAAALLGASMAVSEPAMAVTAFQQWAQGRGIYVPSHERLSGIQDDLAGLGLLPPPDSYAYRYHQLQRRYGVAGTPQQDADY